MPGPWNVVSLCTCINVEHLSPFLFSFSFSIWYFSARSSSPLTSGGGRIQEDLEEEGDDVDEDDPETL